VAISVSPFLEYLTGTAKARTEDGESDHITRIYRIAEIKDI